MGIFSIKILIFFYTRKLLFFCVDYYICSFVPLHFQEYFFSVGCILTVSTLLIVVSWPSSFTSAFLESSFIGYIVSTVLLTSASRPSWRHPPLMLAGTMFDNGRECGMTETHLNMPLASAGASPQTYTWRKDQFAQTWSSFGEWYHQSILFPRVDLDHFCSRALLLKSVS